MAKDYTGQTYGVLTFKKLAPKGSGGAPSTSRYWEAECECGNVRTVLPGDILRLAPPKCRCASNIKVGQKFGFLTVESLADKRGKNSGYYYNLKCICGKESTVAKNDLLKGNSKSCGCKTRELQSLSLGHTLEQATLMAKWRSRHQGMLSRCYTVTNERYANYGARGITVDEELHDLLFFSEVMENIWKICGSPVEFHIDRIDVNLNYTKDNLRVLSPFESMSNKQDTIFVEYQGNKITLAEASRLTKILYATLHWRVQQGWKEPRLFTTETTRVDAITYKGRTQSLLAWCREFDIPYGRTVARIKIQGKSFEEAIL